MFVLRTKKVHGEMPSRYVISVFPKLYFFSAFIVHPATSYGIRLSQFNCTSNICSIDFYDISWRQAPFAVASGGLGLHLSTDIVTSAYFSSV